MKYSKGKGTCPGFYVGLQIDAVSTTKSEMKGLVREMVPE